MESMIFGKNRHFFGGLEPSNMRKFQAKVVDGQVEITAELPNDTVVDGQTLCTVAGAVIRRKIGSYPENEFDGDLIADIKESRTFVDSDVLPEDAACYMAFPYTDQGVYNRSTVGNRASVVYTPDSQPDYIFGYDLDLDDSDPDSRVSYPDDVDNYGYTSMGLVNERSTAFEYGDWTFAPGTYFMPRPCALKYDGDVDHYLDPFDYAKKEDGTTSDVKSSSFDGCAMMEWPKIYTKRWEENGIYKFRCSNRKVDSDWNCWCNYDKNGAEIDHFYTGIYVPLEGTYSENVKYATNIGDGWYIEQFVDRLLIQDLLVMIGGSTDTQRKFGRGCTQGNGYHEMGQTDDRGLFYGSYSNTETNISTKVFGMEDYWGYSMRYIAGLYMTSNYEMLAKFTRSTIDGSAASDYNNNGSGYINVVTFDDEPEGYITETENTIFGRIPSGVGGSSSLYECDHMDADQIVGTVVPAIVGAHGANPTGESRLKHGVFEIKFWDIDNGNHTALSYKPSAT